MTSQDDWDKHSRLVLQSLTALSAQVEKLDDRIGELERRIAEDSAREKRIVLLEEWKRDFDSVVNQRQIVDALNEIEGLKEFKSKATFVFSVIQGAVFVVVFAMKFIKFK